MNIAAEADNITVGYGEHTVLKSVSLAIEQGGFLGILGPNGCGKTTFLRSLSKVLKPEDGVVYIDGKTVSSYDAKTFAKTVGCVSQETETGFEFSVRDIVLMGRLSHYFDLPEEAWQKSLEAMVPPKFLELNKKAFELGKNA